MPCLLLELSHDEVGIVVQELCDPFRPQLAVYLSSTAKGLRSPMQATLANLKHRCLEARAFMAAIRARAARTAMRLRDIVQLEMGHFFGLPLTPGHWRALECLVRFKLLPSLGVLDIEGSGGGNEGVVLFASGLRRGGLPSLQCLRFVEAQIGPEGALALSATLNTRTVPSLHTLCLHNNPIGDVGLAALAPVLRQLPLLENLYLGETGIGDDGVASLVAGNTEGEFKSLKELAIHDNHITDAGCATLATAIRSGALPALDTLSLNDNAASDYSIQEVYDTRS